MESNRKYANAMRENKATTEHREPKNLKELLIIRYGSTEQQYNSGHGVFEYMGATHLSQHTALDAKHSSTRCCSTHEKWELPTPLIVANRSQEGDEARELPVQHLTASWYAQINTTRHKRHGYNRSELNMINASVKQAHIRTSSLLCYNYYNGVPSNTDLTPAKPNTNTSSGTVTQKPRIGSYELNQIRPTLRTQQKALNKAQGSHISILPPTTLNKLSLISVQELRNQYFCDPQWFRDTASRGLKMLLPESSGFPCENPGPTAGRGFNPAGGAPGGG
ncbi:hypothetical protein F511_33773 [Dorcoceras hygrometricum]|uniref:Uncharacterized protein n=1 Tax=Dorcoceras hygrometricum TaxID=472368 RepID=A0A2Z7B9Y0_9LAMI|nr:hypothetical protein F511_33773 [Dorcoceras hygrometricum]